MQGETVKNTCITLQGPLNFKYAVFL